VETIKHISVFDSCHTKCSRSSINSPATLCRHGTVSDVQTDRHRQRQTGALGSLLLMLECEMFLTQYHVIADSFSHITAVNGIS